VEWSDEQQRGKRALLLNAHGVRVDLPERSDNEAIVAYAYPGSPAERAGLHRGDRIVAMNGKLGPGYTVADAFRRTRFSERATFQIETRTGETRELTLERKDYKADPVVLERVLPGGDAPVGYLVLGIFTEAFRRSTASWRSSETAVCGISCWICDGILAAALTSRPNWCRV
jgi:C-terminal processing protease CtpA/Prc